MRASAAAPLSPVDGTRPWAVGPPPGVALLDPVIISSIKNRRKISSNSENIFRSNFLQQKQETGTGHLVNTLVQ